MLQPTGRGPSRYFVSTVINGSQMKTLNFLICDVSTHTHTHTCVNSSRLYSGRRKAENMLEEGRFYSFGLSEASFGLASLVIVNLKFLQD